MDTKFKYEIQLPITRIGHPTPNGLFLDPDMYRAAIERYIEEIVIPGKAILTNSGVDFSENGSVIRIEHGYIHDMIGKIKSIDIDNAVANIIVGDEFKNLNGNEYRLMAALLGERDGHTFKVKRILQYLIVPKLKYIELEAFI